MYLLYFLYFELANRTLAVFNCVAEPVTGDKYLSMLPWLRCSSYAHPACLVCRACRVVSCRAL
jgi:hypothetical protein